MNIEKDKVVSLTYELRKDDAKGEVVEKVDAANALTFIFGSGQLLPDFEKNIIGKLKGEDFEFQLTAEQAYGKYEKDAIMELPKNIFEEDGKINEKLLYIGNYIPMRDEHGNRFDAKVLEIKNDVVVMDFNHPMAGQNLHFKGEVIEVRTATNDELSHGHVHQHGCSGCGGH